MIATQSDIERDKGDKMADEDKKVENPEQIEGKNEEVAEEVAEESKEEIDEAKVAPTSEAVEAPKQNVEKETKDTKKEKPAPSGKFKDMIKEIESMTVSDLAELVKALEERFDVSASAPMMMAGGVAGVGAEVAEQAEEKSSYTVLLKDSGAQKIAVIKAVREINQTLGLKEAKDLVDGAPKEIKKDIPKADADEAKKKLEAAGATVELI